MQARKANETAVIAEKKREQLGRSKDGGGETSTRKWFEEKKKQKERDLERLGLSSDDGYLLETAETADAKYEKRHKKRAPSGPYVNTCSCAPTPHVVFGRDSTDFSYGTIAGRHSVTRRCSRHMRSVSKPLSHRWRNMRRRGRRSRSSTERQIACSMAGNQPSRRQASTGWSKNSAQGKWVRFDIQYRELDWVAGPIAPPKFFLQASKD